MKTITNSGGMARILAINLIARGELSEEEIAQRLGIKLATLKTMAAKPAFIKSLEKERKLVKLERSIREEMERRGLKW